MNPILKNQNHQQVVLTDEILATATVGDGVDLMSYTFLGFATDAAWTTSDVTINVQLDGSDVWIQACNTDGTAFTCTSIAASSHILCPPVPCCRGIQLVAATTQVDDTVLSIIAGNP